MTCPAYGQKSRVVGLGRAETLRRSPQMHTGCTISPPPCRMDRHGGSMPQNSQSQAAEGGGRGEGRGGFFPRFACFWLSAFRPWWQLLSLLLLSYRSRPLWPSKTDTHLAVPAEPPSSNSIPASTDSSISVIASGYLETRKGRHVGALKKARQDTITIILAYFHKSWARNTTVSQNTKI